MHNEQCTMHKAASSAFCILHFAFLVALPALATGAESRMTAVQRDGSNRPPSGVPARYGRGGRVGPVAVARPIRGADAQGRQLRHARRRTGRRVRRHGQAAHRRGVSRRGGVVLRERPDARAGRHAVAVLPRPRLPVQERARESGGVLRADAHTASGPCADAGVAWRDAPRAKPAGSGGAAFHEGLVASTSRRRRPVRVGPRGTGDAAVRAGRHPSGGRARARAAGLAHPLSAGDGLPWARRSAKRRSAPPPAWRRGDPLRRSVAGGVGGLLQNAAAYEVRGSEALGKREWADAITNLRKAIELAPRNPGTRLNLGTALYLTGDAGGALEQFETAVRLSPEFPRRITASACSWKRPAATRTPSIDSRRP